MNYSLYTYSDKACAINAPARPFVNPYYSLTPHPPRTPPPPAAPRRSYRPIWATISAITAATSGVWTDFKDLSIGKRLCGKRTRLISKAPKPLQRVVWACGGLICGVPGALARFGYLLLYQRGTKVFDATATDEDLEAFCNSPAALAVTSIKIVGNNLITKRTLRAIGQCFWLTKIEIEGCTKLDGTCMA